MTNKLELLSDQLENWMKNGGKTIGSLVDNFGEKSFALLFLVLMVQTGEEQRPPV